MLKVCCFDLDGTLLPMDTEAFIAQYLKELAPYVAHVLPPDKLVPLIWDATKTMIANQDETLTNERVFEKRFLAQSGLKKEEIWPLFDRFYAERFPTLKKYVEPSPLSRQVVEAALDRGYRVAVATNPVFPEAAIRERMRWAEVEDLVEWVSVYEETHFCKPQPGYYREVAKEMDVGPEECVMIGNDVQEDMVAGTVGMKTYLVTDYRIDRGEPAYTPDQEGTLEQLLTDIREGNGVFER
ncbi:FMN phosphatase YigB (HAD superfamily) [Melghirimyces profundicolus]|uniref:FMN phosphatase YigB (HAD superfamily) n=1 Tax=Melghirimyces profundicolus TaxID=1242148 RepID=A0A2T6C4P9_9BACL|nr:HAD family hydrolase [Melghirimyces profundicolus]PTX63299.1 FMN phosphatase YigB (HAD superfamily) [Melghirimyces profundicolus]